MIKLSNSKFILVLTKLLILLVIAKTISLFVLWYLPSEGIELMVKENYQPRYQRVDFKNMIAKNVSKKVSSVKQSNSGISITNMILKGLYGTKHKGFVIVTMKSSPKKTSIVGIGESYQGYELKSISLRSAIFNKNGSDFILSLEKIKNSSAITKVAKSQKNSLEVSRKDISYYAKNPDRIWKDISLQEVKRGEELNGFKVTKIDSNSKFASLGLKRGDIIIKVNNIRLKSYRDAIQIYKNIDNLDAVQIVVIRDNHEVELVYEIN
ncbi:PDZ domain-containing protein [Sulfurimonas sp.]|uniref:PDZ domain-containing protein n=1 Tax=Sulfurimonas sp. TaxID=2022749 RepID=UPI002B483BF5|nr:PDZ domain-containing protein [Sulfurimonas sp.]